MLPFASVVIPNGASKDGAPGGAPFWVTVVLTPVTGSTRITPPPPPNAFWSETRMSPFAASVSANGSTKAGPPAGLAFSDTVVRCPVTGFTRITPPPAPANAL